jgi:hypothetical protein
MPTLQHHQQNHSILLHEDQRKADAEAEQRRIAALIDSLPDPDDPDPPAHGHFNTGDLSPVPPTVDDRALEDPEELAHPTTPAQRAPVAVSLNSMGNHDDDEDLTLAGNPPPGRVGY